MAKLVLVRHGQSIWNLENRFTGWVDISLSPKGVREAKKAGKLLENMKFDIAFTSELSRAQQTLFEIMKNNKQRQKLLLQRKDKNYNNFTPRKEDKDLLPVFISEALNERHYGKLQGLNKDETREKFGKEQVHIWRRSYNVAPPEGESLKDTSARTLPYLKKQIFKELKQGKDVLVAAHGNSLRAIIKYLDKMTPEEILKFEVGTGVPYVYYFDEDLNITQRRVLK